MAERNYIDVLVRMIEASKFQRDAERSSKAVKGIGDQAERTGKRTGASLRSLAKWAASAYIFKRAATFLHGAVDETVNLAKASLQVQRLTGMDVGVSSEWVVIAKQRGIEAQRLGIMFTQLGRTQQRAIAGSKAQADAFAQVGVSVSDLRSLDATGLIVKVADAFAAMPDGLQKAALAQQLFGRTGRQLLPLLNQGSTALQANLDMVEKYGAGLSGKTADDVKEMIARQRELDIAMMGVKEQLADALIPLLTALAPVLTQVAQAIQPFTKNAWAVRAALVALTAAWGLYTVATIATTVASMELGAVLWGTGIAVALLAIGAVALLIATHWKELGQAVDWAVGKIMAAVDKVKGPVQWVADKLGALGGLVNPGNLVPHMAAGGTVTAGGSALVGERGPEVVRLPRAARVEPLPRSAASTPAAGGPTQVTIPLIVDGRELARAVWKSTGDSQART